MDPRTGLIFNLHRLSTDDGPGLRDTFFFKGCHLKCVWCHNPESLSPAPEVWWTESKCIGARDCLRDCPERALTLTAAGMTIDRERCTGCGICVESCPSKAFELLGKPWTAAQMLREALKDQIFFKNSGGGVTVSGGEPVLQAPLVAEFLRACREEGLHTALDTCGFPAWDDFERVLAHSDLVLYDIKEMDAGKHISFTGVSNERILANLLRLRDYRDAQGGTPVIWIRTPLVPGFTATRENVSAIGRFLRDNLGDRVERWDLCAFNNTCAVKYAKLGREWPLRDQSLLDRTQGNLLLEEARRHVARPQSVHLTGLV